MITLRNTKQGQSFTHADIYDNQHLVPSIAMAEISTNIATVDRCFSTTYFCDPSSNVFLNFIT